MSPFILFPLGEILSLMENLWAIFNFKVKKEKILKKLAVNLFIRRVSEKKMGLKTTMLIPIVHFDLQPFLR